MYIPGIGNVEGLSPNTKIVCSNGKVRAGDLDDQYLSLVVSFLLDETPLATSTGDNRNLRKRLRELNLTNAQNNN